VNKADLKTLLDQVVSNLVEPSLAISIWSRESGSISVGTAGYRAISAAAEMLKSQPAWNTYPHGYLLRVAADALIDGRGDTAVALDAIEAKLNSGLGHQRAYVPFWGFHLRDGLEFDFGPYKLAQIGEGRYDAEILGHVRLFEHANDRDTAVGDRRTPRRRGFVAMLTSRVFAVLVAATTSVGTSASAGDQVYAPRVQPRTASGLRLNISPAASSFQSGSPIVFNVSLSDVSAGALSIADVTLTGNLTTAFRLTRISSGSPQPLRATGISGGAAYSLMPQHALNDGGALTAARDLSKRFALTPGTYQVQVNLDVDIVSQDGTTHYYGSVLSNAVTIEVKP
jgi:hypothetical protein